MNTLSRNRLAPFYSIALVLLVLIALIYIVAALPFGELGAIRFHAVSPWVIPVILVLHIVYLLASAEVWRRMVFAVSGRLARFSEAYLQMAAVAAGKYVPGKVWGFVARTGQLSRIAVPARLSVTSTVIEQVVVLLGGGLVAIGAAMVIYPEHAFVIALAGAALLAGFFVVFRYVPAIIDRLQKDRADAKSSPVEIRKRPWYWLRFALAYAGLWLVSGLTLCAIYFSLFDVAVTADKLAALILANTIGFIAGFLAIFSPGGLGVREAATVAVLAPFLPVKEALIATIALRAWMVLFDGINGGILLLAELRHAAKSSN